MESDEAPATKGKVIVDINVAIDGTAEVKGEDSQTIPEKVVEAGTESSERCPRKDTCDDSGG